MQNWSRIPWTAETLCIWLYLCLHYHGQRASSVWLGSGNFWPQEGPYVVTARKRLHSKYTWPRVYITYAQPHIVRCRWVACKTVHSCQNVMQAYVSIFLFYFHIVTKQTCHQVGVQIQCTHQCFSLAQRLVGPRASSHDGELSLLCMHLSLKYVFLFVDSWHT
jgi:hypothetical protein